jgi:hypothetical protein
MIKKSNFATIIAILLMAIVFLAMTSCGSSQENKSPYNQNQDSIGDTTNNTSGDVSSPKTDDTQNNPGNKTVIKRDLPVIPATRVEVKLDTQFVSAMAILPQTSITHSENNLDPMLTYSNIGKLAKINGIKKGGIPKDKQFLLSYCPSVFFNLSSKPLNQIEDVSNWYWTATHTSTGSSWLAGDLALDTILMPSIKDLRYEKQLYPGTGLSVYIQTTDGMFPKYGKTIVPLGRDLFYFNTTLTDPVLANDTFRNLNIEKTLGLLGKSPIKNLLSLCGDPEQAILTSPRKRASGILSTVPEQMKKDFSETLVNIKDLERHPGLVSVAVCYDRTLDRPLRFVFGYESKEQLEDDFPRLASIWGKVGKGNLDWTKMISLTDTFFSKSLTCGIVECKVDKNIPPYSIINSFHMMIQGGYMPELWLR